MLMLPPLRITGEQRMSTRCASGSSRAACRTGRWGLRALTFVAVGVSLAMVGESAARAGAGAGARPPASTAAPSRPGGVDAQAATAPAPDRAPRPAPAPIMQLLSAPRPLDVDDDSTADTILRQPRWRTDAPVHGRVVIRSGFDGLERRSFVGPDAGDLFGYAAIAIDDLDGDGRADLAVAAPMAAARTELWGRVYLLSSADGRLLAELAGEPDEIFGVGLSLAADRDADGRAELVVGTMRSAHRGTPAAGRSRERSSFGPHNLISDWSLVSPATGDVLMSGRAADLGAFTHTDADAIDWSIVKPAGDGPERGISLGHPADIDADGTISLGDVMEMLSILATRSDLLLAAAMDGPQLSRGAPRRGDVNLDQGVDTTDLLDILNRLGQDIETDGDAPRFEPAQCATPPFGALKNCLGIGDGRKNPGGGFNPGKPGPETDPGGPGNPCPGCPKPEDPKEPKGPKDCTGPPAPGSLDECDDDCDGIPNWADCDSGTFAGDPSDCADDDKDGVPNQNDPDSDSYTPPMPPVDLDADTNNNGVIGTHRNYHEQAEEEAEEDRKGAPGRILVVKYGDADNDGVPDFADGYDRDGEPDDDETSTDGVSIGHQLEPMVLHLRGAALEKGSDGQPRTLIFDYDLSDPLGVAYDTDGPFGPRYEPAPGSLRVWLIRNPEVATRYAIRDARDVKVGGDLVVPDVEYLPSDFGGTDTIHFAVESVRSSDEMGDQRVSVHIPGLCADSVPFTSIGNRFVEALESGPGDEVVHPEISHPSPVIEVSELSLQNVRTSSDQQRLLVDIDLQLQVLDRASDLIPGKEGTINSISVVLNGKPLQIGSDTTESFELVVSKTQSPSILAPFPYAGTLVQQLSSVEVQTGYNRLLLACTNAHGGIGYVEYVFKVIAEPPPEDVFEFTMHFMLGAPSTNGISSPDGILLDWRFTVSGVESAGESVLYNNGSNHFIGEDLLARLHPPQHIGDSWWASLYFLEQKPWITRPACTELSFQLEPHPTGLQFTGRCSNPRELSAPWQGYALSLDPIIDSTRSLGGSLRPVLIEILGPVDLVSILSGVDISDQDYDIRTHGGRMLLWLPEAQQPRAFVCGNINIGPQLPEEDGPESRLGPRAFTEGFVAGFYDAGKSQVEGVADLLDGVVAIGKFSLHIVWNYNPWSIRYRAALEEEAILPEDQRRLDAAAGVIEDLARFIVPLAAGEASLIHRALVLGDEEAMNQLGDQFRVAIQLTAEIYEAVEQHFVEMNDFDRGRLCGRITGEVAVMCVSQGASVITRATIIPQLVQRLSQIPAFQRHPAFINGALVHWALRAQRGPQHMGRVGQQIHAIVEQAGVDLPGHPIDRARYVMDSLEVMNGGRIAADEVAHLLLHSTNEMYALATQNGIDTSLVRSVASLRYATDGWRAINDIEIHHPIPQKWFKVLFEERFGHPPTQIQIDSMPGLILPRTWHNRGVGTNGRPTFHDILSSRLGPNPSADDIVRELENTYDQFDAIYGAEAGTDYRRVWQVSKQWLREQDVIDP